MKQSWKPGTMIYPLPAVLVSCGETDGEHNLFTVAWTGTVCTNPPMCYISVRPERHSYEIIKRTGEFVINLTTTSMVKNADRCGTYSGRNVDKFKNETILRSNNGLTYLSRYINSYLSLDVVDSVDLGTHMLFICDVYEAEVLSNKPTMTYAYYHEHVKPKPTASKGYVCEICGYVYQGDTLPDDYICPLCKHGASDFKKID